MNPTPTVVQRIEELIGEISEMRDAVGRNPSGREFSMSITNLEDAMIRYTRGRAMQEGVQRNYDFDREE